MNMQSIAILKIVKDMKQNTSKKDADKQMQFYQNVSACAAIALVLTDA